MTATAGEASTPNQHLIFTVDGESYVTVTDAAHRVGATAGAIRERINLGSLRSRKVGGHRLVLLADLDGWTHRGKRPLPDDVRVARKIEKNRRQATAQSRALHATARLHHDEYLALWRQYRAEINAERGPLPGDEVA
jgi:excisionase family DNA binding protein